MDTLESEVLEQPSGHLRHSISEVRKSAIMLRRYIAPQRDVLSSLKTVDMAWLTRDVERRLQEVHDNQLRGIESLDAIRERSQVVMDELVSAVSDKLNSNLYVLSVITAIFLPLGFLTGLFGINVGGIPGVNDDHAFVNFVLLLTGITALQIVIFKLLKWF